MAEEGYLSRLPDDAIKLIADSFLETNDLDCYMDLRVVCSDWRRATLEPSTDAKFLPRNWIMLEHSIFEDGVVTFVNLSTGRFIRKKISNVIKNYFFVSVTTTTGKQYFAMCHKNTAKAQLNTAEALPCFDTRQNVHGIYWHDKDICRVYF
jgi:hypothetical protein